MVVQVFHLFTILTSIVLGVLVTGRIDGPYTLDDEGSSGHSPTRWSSAACLCVTRTVGGE